ncbi:hypothetical protein I5S53_08605 [Pseudomonas juntendi]|uniref:hypothetical protein n=1 Tax=Pseudomonas juntendi TaxID=2666183 RepID=UPI0018D97048|nr:hypothetical protein [Pseudomonas juntendi]MBH3384031.1 hypothetical protein [Pseudomonas juntendi]MDG9918540.1 hypothetical protein [Pseudomonas juntendi]MDH0508124.1 hypothetical protein [Pseudomonas juntendi]MDH1043200.1 hypothetical protein [Pseudomonas juntendi]
MNYNEFTDYLADQIVATRHHGVLPGARPHPQRYYDAVYKAVLDSRAFFDRFKLDEGPHNDYNPASNASAEAYRTALYDQLAKALAMRAAEVCSQGDESFLNSVLVHRIRYGETISNQRFARVAADYLSNITFERTCGGCGAKYKVAVKAQTYRMISNNHPATCSAVGAVTKPEKKVQAADEQNMEELYKIARANQKMFMARGKGNRPSGPTIPEEMLKPSQKPAYNSPAYREKTKAALRLYAEFLKFYEESPLPQNSSPEENQRQMDRIYNVVVRTVFHFDQNANNKQ